MNTELANIQSTLKAPKGQKNTFGNYFYRSCEDILEAVKPLLDGATITLSDEVVETGGRVYIKAVATFTDSAGGLVQATGFAREAETKKGMDEAQITGSASSYARKYALNGLFCIDDTKDSDATNNGRSSEPKKKEEAISSTQKENIMTLIKKGNLEDENVVTSIKWASDQRTYRLNELSQSEAAKLIAGLTKKIES